MKMIIHIATFDVYQFNGWVFEWRRGRPISPWPLKKDGEPRARAGMKFYRETAPFFDLEPQQQDQHFYQPKSA